jgi:3-methylcrotonyl-CoA carboxylase alpha subunit
VQVFADQHGSIVHLFDRDCSVQRRHQKLIEEAPAPGLDADVREGLYKAACTVAREVGYVGAGTIEFLLSGREFYFMEMNTRLQVEHPVTESITGLDLVEWQLRVAAGEPLPLKQQQIERRGHSIEVRLCAEDPASGFVPSAGKLELLCWPPQGDGIRVDAGFETGDEVPSLYDSLLGKIIAYAPSREAAVDKLIDGVSDVRASGVATNASWLVKALDHPEFRSGDVSTAFVGRHGEELIKPVDAAALAPFAAAAYAESLAPHAAPSSPWDLADSFRAGLPASLRVPLKIADRSFDVNVLGAVGAEAKVRVNGAAVELKRGAAAVRSVKAEHTTPERGRSHQGAGSHESAGRSNLLQRWHIPAQPPADVLVTPHRISVWQSGDTLTFAIDDGSQFDVAASAHAGGLTTPLPGVVVSVAVKEGDTVTAGQTLLVIEAMKMEHAIKSPRAGSVKSLKLRVGDRVREGSTLAEIE